VFKNTTDEVAVDFTKERGRSLKVSEIPNAFALFFPVGFEGPSQSQPSTQSEQPSDCGLPLSTLLPILRGIHSEIKKIRDVYSTIEMRMVGGSFLIVYEADWERAAEGVEKMMKKEQAGSGGVYEDEDEDADADDDDEEEDGENSKRTIPFTVKLIDFAHTHVTPGEGPDEGVLLGMDKVLEVIGARIKDLAKDQSPS
jgi:1D-myo-inositol-tetrakisphosphate 5-kinase/inositol-polyphosphate multikinase